MYTLRWIVHTAELKVVKGSKKKIIILLLLNDLWLYTSFRWDVPT